MGILDGFRTKEAAEARAAARQAAAEAKNRDVIRQAIAAEKDGGDVAEKAGQTVVDYHVTEAKYNSSKKSLESSLKFFELADRISKYDAEIDANTEDAVRIAEEFDSAADILVAAKGHAEEAWPDGNYIDAADAVAEAEATLTALRMQKQARVRLIEHKTAKRNKLMTQQSELDCWIDPTSELHGALRFALCDGPREVPETAKATAEGQARKAREQRRLAQKADAEKQISELTKQVAGLDRDIEKLESKIDSRPSGTAPVQSSIDWQQHQRLKSQRELARRQIAELELKRQSLGSW